MKEKHKAEQEKFLAKLADIAIWTIIVTGSCLVVYVIYTGLYTIFSV